MRKGLPGREAGHRAFRQERSQRAGQVLRLAGGRRHRQHEAGLARDGRAGRGSAGHAGAGHAGAGHAGAGHAGAGPSALATPGLATPGLAMEAARNGRSAGGATRSVSPSPGCGAPWLRARCSWGSAAMTLSSPARLIVSLRSALRAEVDSTKGPRWRAAGAPEALARDTSSLRSGSGGSDPGRCVLAGLPAGPPAEFSRARLQSSTRAAWGPAADTQPRIYNYRHPRDYAMCL